MKKDIVKIVGAGCYSGEYNRSKTMTVRQEINFWRQALENKNCEYFTIMIGHFKFGKGCSEDGTFVCSDIFDNQSEHDREKWGPVQPA